MLYFFTVAYHPQQNLVQNVVNAVSAGLIVYVYNNGMNAVIRSSLLIPNVIILGSGTNAGLGVAFGEFEKYHVTIDDFYLYLDQDTVLEYCDWVSLSRNFSYLFNNCSVGLVHINNSKPSTSVVVNSGSLFSGYIINHVVKHDPTYFVEGLDYSYCYDLYCHNLIVEFLPLLSFDHNRFQEGKRIVFFCFSFMFEFMVTDDC